MPILPLSAFPKQACQNIHFVLTDVDDTLTLHGRLPVEALQALVELEQAGIQVIPVTGGCAGWSDMLARTLPVSGVITEGGACFIKKNHNGSLEYIFWQDEIQMREQQAQLLTQVAMVLDAFPDLRLARDQDYRLTDVAIDFAQNVKPPALKEKDQCLTKLLELGFNAKASSIHINVCQTGYNKFKMAKRVLMQHYGLTPNEQRAKVLYIGDAPNDESMFAEFPLSVGVANIREHIPGLIHPPGYISQTPGGLGFAEIAQFLLENRPL